MEVAKCFGLFVFICSVISINGFTWSHCSGYPRHGQVIRFRNFKLAPDPITLPGKVDIKFNAEVTGHVVPPLKLEVQIWKLIKIWGFTRKTRIYGCCSYDDICYSLGVESTGFTCGDDLLKNCIDCTCPPTPGFYNTSMGSVGVTIGKLPHLMRFLANGEFEARLILKDGNGDRLECLNLELSMRTARKRRSVQLKDKIAHENKMEIPAYGIMPKYCYPEEQEVEETTMMLPMTSEEPLNSFTTIEIVDSTVTPKKKIKKNNKKNKKKDKKRKIKRPMLTD